MLSESSIFDYYRLNCCLNWKNKKNNITEVINKISIMERGQHDGLVNHSVTLLGLLGGYLKVPSKRPKLCELARVQITI